MVTDSYSVSCYIENKNGQYHIECDMISEDEEFYSDYDGDNFVDGLNKIMVDMTEKMLAEPEPETLEEKVVRLENLVTQLQAENADLNDYINNLTSDCENDCEKESKDKDNHINEAVKNFEEAVDNYINNSKVYDKLYKKWAESYY